MLGIVTAQQAPTPFNQRVGANVGKFRRAADMSQAELAQELTRRGFPMQQQTILTIEKGTRPLKLDEFAVMADVLRIDPGSLVDATDERTAALAKLRATEAAIARCDRERESHRQEIERLDQEIENQELLRREASQRLVVVFEAEGRPDLATIYANLEPGANLIKTWKKIRRGQH